MGNETKIIEQEFAKIPQNMGDYDELVQQGVTSFGVKERVNRYGCEFESIVENNTYAPATLVDGKVTPDTKHWRLVTGIPGNYGLDGKMANLQQELNFVIQNFVTKTVNDLVNYYTKSDTYTQNEVQQLIAAVKQFTYEVVSTLPTASASTMNKIYLTPASQTATKNVKDEYITIATINNGTTTYNWEQIGSTNIDLSGYYTKQQTDAAITSALNSALTSYSTTSQMNTAISNAVSTEQSRAKAAEQLLQEQYNALTQSDIIVGILPASGIKNKIYRVPGTNTYSDYMWNGTQFVKMATYDNATDDVPTADSNNLVKSGGVYRATPTIVDSEEESDLDISDEEGNILARFYNGHVYTKNFSSEDVQKSQVSVADDSKADFDISDEMGNVLMRVVNGHIKTKNFDSENSDISNNFPPLLLYALNKKSYNDVVAPSWTLGNEYAINTDIGVNNRFTLNREYSANLRIITFDISISSGTKVYLGTEQGVTNASGKVGVILDLPNNNIYSFANSEEALLQSNVNIPENEPIRIEIKKVGNMNYSNTIVSIYRIKDYNVIYSKEGVSGAFYDKPMIYCTSGTVKIFDLTVKISNLSKNWKLAIYGDSITEGHMAGNEGWAYLVQDKIGKSFCTVSGRDTSTIAGVAAKISAECTQENHPEYIMVTIGTNGGNTSSNITALINQILGLGSKPIINHVSRTKTNTQSGINDVIDSVINSFEERILCTRMDVALSANFNLNDGPNSLAFVSPSDGLHPTTYGHRLMYEQVIKDCQELFNN